MAYYCAECGGELTVADNFRNGGMISVNVNGHAKPAHRVCPPTAEGGTGEPVNGNGSSADT